MAEEPITEAPVEVRAKRRWLWPALEVVTSFATALLLTWTCTFIAVDPMDRVGQVSGLAAVQLRFAIIAILLVAILLLVHRLGPAAWRSNVVRLGCAAVAGLSTGVVAGGIVVALHGTPFGLWAGEGDFIPLFEWVRNLRDGKPTTDHYPPLFMYALAGYTWLKDSSMAYTLKDLQIVGTALFGPAVYAAWRMVLKPGWALGIGVVAALTFIQPLKPYREVVLVALVPVVIAYLRRIRAADQDSLRRAAVSGGLFGLLFGVLFMLYSGWFVWIAPGALLAFALLAPWREHWRTILLRIGATLAVFVPVSWTHLRGLFGSSGGQSDGFMYFDTFTEPAYIAMWRDDRPLDVSGSPWPPLGELSGVGLFTVLLAAGVGLAIWQGYRRTAVVLLLSTVAGAWLVRMALASQMYESQLVKLYPRTTQVLLYCLLLLTGLGVMYAVRNAREFFARSPRPSLALAPVGLLLVPVMFFFASAGSSIGNYYMPDSHLRDYGYFAWMAHVTRQHDGTCPRFGVLHGGCDQSPETSPYVQRKNW